MSRRGGELYSRWAPAPWHHYVLRSDPREDINVTDPHDRSTVHAGSGAYVKLNCYEWSTQSIEIRPRREPRTPRRISPHPAISRGFENERYQKWHQDIKLSRSSRERRQIKSLKAQNCIVRPVCGGRGEEIDLLLIHLLVMVFHRVLCPRAFK